jgi:hypothetical protein
MASWKPLLRLAGHYFCNRHAIFRNEALAYTRPELKKLAEKCLRFNHESRPDFSQIMKDLVNVGQENHVQKKQEWPFCAFAPCFFILPPHFPLFSLLEVLFLTILRPTATVCLCSKPTTPN